MEMEQTHVVSWTWVGDEAQLSHIKPFNDFHSGLTLKKRLHTFRPELYRTGTTYCDKIHFDRNKSIFLLLHD